MAKEYIKKYLRWKPEVIDIFDELDKYREFCVQFGRVYDEREMGNERSQNWIDYQEANLNNPIFWYIVYNESLLPILGSPNVFRVIFESPI
jgi:hypothetical protein